MLKVKYERLRRGWNQTALAFYTGMSVSDISRIETGRIRPYPGQLQKLSKVLGVDCVALLEDTASAQEHASATPEPQSCQAKRPRVRHA